MADITVTEYFVNDDHFGGQNSSYYPFSGSGGSTVTGIQWSGATVNGVGTYVDAKTILSNEYFLFDGTTAIVGEAATAYGAGAYTVTVGSTTLGEYGEVEVIGNRDGSGEKVAQLAFRNEQSSHGTKLVGYIYVDRGSGGLSEGELHVGITNAAASPIDAWLVTPSQQTWYTTGVSELVLNELYLQPSSDQGLSLGSTDHYWLNVWGVNARFTGLAASSSIVNTLVAADENGDLYPIELDQLDFDVLYFENTSASTVYISEISGELNFVDDNSGPTGWRLQDLYNGHWGDYTSTYLAPLLARNVRIASGQSFQIGGTDIYITDDSAGNLVFADGVISAGEVTLSDLIGGGPGGNVTIGSTDQIPFSNAGTPGTDFDYSANLTFDDTSLNLGSGIVFNMANVNIQRASAKFLYYAGGDIRMGNNAGNDSQTGSSNTIIGSDSGRYLTDSSNSTTLGYAALGTFSDTGDNNITAIGTYALGYIATNGDNNTAVGYFAGGQGTSGNRNTFIGSYAGLGVVSTSSGANNVAIGYYAAAGYTTAVSTVAIGYEAARYGTTNNYTVAIGYQAAKGASSPAFTGANNVAIGNAAGYDLQTGASNVFLGNISGTNTTTGSQNIAIGSYALQDNQGGSDNIALGNYALANTTSNNNNIAIGDNAFYNGTSLTNCIAIGEAAGSDASGDAQILIGRSTGQQAASVTGLICLGYYAGYLSEGDYNVYVGHHSGHGGTASAGCIGTNNIGIGQSALYQVDLGNYNIAIGGYQTGWLIGSGSYNILIGNDVDVDTESDSYLYRVGYSTNYLLDGVIQSGSQTLTINGTFFLPGISNTDRTETLQYNTADGEVSYYDDTSDKRLKQDIKPIKNASAKLSKYETFTYRFNKEAKKAMGHNVNTVHLGMYAQDVMVDFPEAVSQKANGYYKLWYTDLIPVLTAAHNEHTDEIKSLKEEIEELRKLVKSLM